MLFIQYFKTAVHLKLNYYYCLMQKVNCNTVDCFLCKYCFPGWKELISLKKTTWLFKKGETIFSERESVKGIFFIYSGAVKVYKQWGDDKQLIIRFAKTGDILGHRGLGGNKLYPVSATALENTSACFITDEFLEATLQTNHFFIYQLMQFYMEEMQKAEARMRNLAHMEVKGRIAEALLDIQHTFGVNGEGYIGVTIIRQDIASYAGTTYETVFKFFNELTSQKIIRTSGKDIRILNEKKLRSFIPE